MHTYGPTPYTDEHWRGHFSTRALFVGENIREAVNAGRASYAPVFLSDIPALFLPDGPLPIDVAMVQVSPPDTHGYCSLGPSVDVARAALDYARHVIALVNPNMPRTHGDSFIHISQIECAVNYDGPLYAVERRKPDETQMQIGRNVATLIEDGATLQLGIGVIPDAVLQSLGDRHDLGVHTEMFSDGVLDLVELGVVTGERKELDKGKIVSSFVVGSRRLMDFIHDNPTVEMRPTDYTNNTVNIRRFDHMVAVNSAIQVDLTGQVCAESIGTRLYSGVGGQMDFMRGAALSKRGRPIIALPATARAPRRTRRVRNADPNRWLDLAYRASAGAAVTTSRTHVHDVATEYGVAELHSRTLSERASSLINIAAPQFREGLERAAYELHLLA